MDGVGDDGGGCGGVELLNVSKFNSGVDRARNADNDDKSSLFCARIFELNFVLPTPLLLPPTCLLLTAVVAFVLVFAVMAGASAAGVAVSIFISSAAIGSISNSVFNSRDATVADPVFCNDGNKIFKFGRSNFLCLYTGAGRNVDNNDESVAVDDIDTDVDVVVTVAAVAADVVVVSGGNGGGGGACIIFFGTKLKRFIPDAGNADGDIVDFFAFKSALKCSG